MAVVPYSFGNLLLHDSVQFYVQKFDISPPTINVAMAKVARTDGMKKTGQTVNERHIKVSLLVVAADGTRETFFNCIDTLLASLAIPAQHLVFNIDGRYYIADCTNKTVLVERPSSCAIELEFLAYQPYAYGTATSQTLTNSSIGNGINNVLMTIVNGGNATTFPVITVTNTGSHNLTGFFIQNLTSGFYLNVSGITSLTPGEYMTITCDPFAANNLGLTIIKNNVVGTRYDFTGVFPSLDSGTTQWQFTANNSPSTTVTINFAWQPRWLS